MLVITQTVTSALEDFASQFLKKPPSRIPNRDEVADFLIGICFHSRWPKVLEGLARNIQPDPLVEDTILKHLKKQTKRIADDLEELEPRVIGKSLELKNASVETLEFLSRGSLSFYELMKFTIHEFLEHSPDRTYREGITRIISDVECFDTSVRKIHAAHYPKDPPLD